MKLTALAFDFWATLHFFVLAFDLILAHFKFLNILIVFKGIVSYGDDHKANSTDHHQLPEYLPQ
ncbi:Uncharacterised protein [Yersinia enterocolitica]|nr:Uncharacterised protein [Yersinia enterocolitica]